MRRLLFLLAFFAHPVPAQYEPSPPDQAAKNSRIGKRHGGWGLAEHGTTLFDGLYTRSES